MRFFAPRTTTNSFKTHSAWVHESGLVQIAVSSMLRLDCPNSKHSSICGALSIRHYRFFTNANPLFDAVAIARMFVVPWLLAEPTIRFRFPLGDRSSLLLVNLGELLL
jgi:hypothetical protein